MPALTTPTDGPISENDIVRARSSLPGFGVSVGTLGTVRLAHGSCPPAFEVEFEDGAGRSLGTFTVEGSDLVLVTAVAAAAERHRPVMLLIEAMLSASAVLRGECRSLVDEAEPHCPLPTVLMGEMGQVVAEGWDAIPADEWTRLSALIEGALASDDDDLGTAVATGLIEGLIHRAEAIGGLWPRVEAALGPEARDYADAYRRMT